MRVDVLVEMQHILGVVLFLDLDKSSVVRGVSCPDKFIARFAQLVDVHAMRKGLQFVTQSLDPFAPQAPSRPERSRFPQCPPHDPAAEGQTRCRSLPRARWRRKGAQ